MSLADAFFVLHRPIEAGPWDRDAIEANARATDPGASWRFLECGRCFLGWRGGPSHPEREPALGLFTGSINADEMGLLSAYIISGPDGSGPVPADGAFAGAVVDHERGRVTLVTDRFGLYPLYRAEKDGTSCYATSLPLICAVARVDRAIEETGFYELIFLGLVLEGRTFLRDVRLVAPASMVRLEEGHPDTRPYWTWRSLASGPPTSASTSDDDLAWETYGLIEKAVLKSIPAGPSKIGVPLSGGLDSRMICAVLARNGIPFHTYHVTHGRGNEVALARQVAQALAAPFTLIDAYRNPANSIPAALDASDRGYRTDQTWGYEMAETMAADGCSVLLDGLAFDAVLGAVLRVQGDDPDDLAQALEHGYRDVPGAFLGEVAGPRTGQNAEESMRASLRAGAGECIDQAGPLASEYFVMNYRVRRYTFGYCLANMGVLPGRFPFISREIFEHCMRLPVAQRDRSQLYRRIYQLIFPDLARIPWAKTGLPLDQYATPRTSRFRSTLEAAVRRATHGRFHLGPVSTFEELVRNDPDFRSAMTRACEAPSLYPGHDWARPLREAMSSRYRGRNMAYLVLPLYTAQQFLSWDALTPKKA